MLQLYLLGPPRVELNGAPVKLNRRKVLALLCYLAVSGEAQPRDKLAALFWPEYGQSAARKALRRDLSLLKQALDGEWLVVEGETVGLRTDYWLDVAHFQQQTAAAQDDPTALAAAIELFRDDFLAGFSLADAPDFEEWQRFQSESLRQILTSALEQMTELLNQQRELEPAISYARRWVALDPLHEPAQRQLMGLYAQAGQVAAALRQYQACVDHLDAELGVPPAAETSALFTAIRSGKLTDLMASSATRSSGQPLHNLPIQTTTFVGRERELADIQRLLLDEPGCRLLNIVGPGGVGKTRLALAAASQVYPAFSHGACFISLSTVESEEYILPAIAEALGLILYDQPNSKAQLWNYLRQKQLLLLVDNLEHLVAGSTLLSELLRQAPDVTLLVTSRTRLHLQEEWVYALQGLSYPIAVNDESDELNSDRVEAYAAWQLFAQRARQVRADFALASADMADLLRICKLVDGLPLGLELAAAWVRVLSCGEIAQEIEKGIDFLTTAQRNLPERHRSLQAVFEHSWQLLNPDEQRIFASCSLFRGGFTRAALAQVTGASLAIVAALIDKSLLHREANGRYAIHELARQFAQQKLQTFSDAERELLLRRHAAFFLHLVHSQETTLFGAEAQQASATLQSDLENVHRAWNWACTHRQVDLLAKALAPLARFYKLASLVHTGEQLFAVTTKAVPAPLLTATELRLFDRQIPFHRAELLYLLAHYDEAGAIAARVYTLAAAVDDAELQARTQILLGQIAFKQGQHERAHQLIEQGYSCCLQVGDDRLLAFALDNLGNILHVRKVQNYGLAQHQQACRLAQEQGDRWALATYLSNLGWMHYDKWESDAALDYFEQALALQQQLNVGYDMIETHLRIGQTHHQLHNEELALQHYEQAMHITTKLGLRDNSQAWLAIGNVYRRKGDWDRAVWWLEKARRLLIELGKSAMLAECTGSLARIFSGRGQYHLAQLRHREALGIYLRLKMFAAAGHQHCHLGVVYQRMGNYEAAQRRLGEALALARAYDDRVFLPQILQESAELALSMKAYAAAQSYCEECIELVHSYGAQQHFFRQAEVTLGAQLLRAKLTYLCGNEDEAIHQLAAMLAGATTQAAAATIHFTRWQMDQDAHSRGQALARYRQIYAQEPYFQYRQRIEALAAREPANT